MRLRWLVAVCACVLLAEVSLNNLMAQDGPQPRLLSPLNAGALRLGPVRPGQGLSARQEAARIRAQQMRLAGSGQQANLPVKAATNPNAATPGFGGFAAAKFMAGGGLAGASVLITADMNHDGKPDLTAVDYYGEVEVFINDGKGGFGSPIRSSDIPYMDLSSGQINSAIAEDMNGDGYPDLVLGGTQSYEPEGLPTTPFDVFLVLFNQRDGTFGPPTTITLTNPNSSGSPQYGSFAVAKTTSSGYSDIVTVEPARSISGDYYDEVLLQTFVNDGTGKFTAKPIQTIPIPASQQSFSLAEVILSDVNHDGKMDALLETESSGSVSTGDNVNILLGNGDGTFQLPNASTAINFSTSNEFGGQLQFGLQLQSLTGDPSKLDMILDDGSGVSIAMSNGDGTFKTPVQIPNLGVTDIGYIEQALFSDLNGDGILDLIAVTEDGLQTNLGNGDGTFGGITGTAYAYAAEQNPYHGTVLADFDGDGKVDFANVDITGDVQIGLGRGDGTFVAAPMLYSAGSIVPKPSQFFAQTAVDLNGDGIPDLVGGAGSPNYGLTSALTNATGGFTYHTALALSAYSSIVNVDPIAADFNGDGKQDVVMIGIDGTIAVALSNGDGTLNEHVAIISLAPTLDCFPGYAVAGDINGDGKMDILVPYFGDHWCGSGTIPSGYFTVLGNGDGTFVAPVFHALGSELGLIAVAKFHGPNQPLDLIAADAAYNLPSSVVTLLKGDGTGGFGTATDLKLPYYPAQILTDDFNQDGKPDLTIVVEQNGSINGQALLCAGNGDGTFGAAQNVDGTVIGDYALYADLNGDGIPDLVGSGLDTHMSVNLGLGKGTFAAPIDYFFADVLLAAGNFLGDNTQSIIGMTNAGGTVFFMNQGGTALTVTPSSASLTPGESVTLTANLTPTLAGQPEPTGTVTFFDGATRLGSEAVGTPLAVSSLALGAHSITAKYSGDGHFNPNTSAAVSVTVAVPPAPDFSFTSTGGSLTVAKGSSGTLSLTVAANVSLSAAVSFACSGLPSEATCAFAPASLNVAAGAMGTSVLTIATKAASSNVRARADSRSALPGLGVVAMAGMLCFLLPRRRGMWMVLFVVLGVGAIAGLSGCGGGSGTSKTPPPPTDPGTPAGTSNVTVTATAVAGSTTLTHTMTVALTVQ